MNRKQLGKISRASFGLGGYQGCQIGLSLTFQGKGWEVGYFVGAWATKRTECTQRSEEERLLEAGRAAMKLAELLKASHKMDVWDLVGVPVECMFDRNMLVDWRLLTEVL